MFLLRVLTSKYTAPVLLEIIDIKSCKTDIPQSHHLIGWIFPGSKASLSCFMMSEHLWILLISSTLRDSFFFFFLAAKLGCHNNI